MLNKAINTALGLAILLMVSFILLQRLLRSDLIKELIPQIAPSNEWFGDIGLLSIAIALLVVGAAWLIVKRDKLGVKIAFVLLVVAVFGLSNIRNFGDSFSRAVTEAIEPTPEELKTWGPITPEKPVTTIGLSSEPRRVIIPPQHCVLFNPYEKINEVLGGPRGNTQYIDVSTKPGVGTIALTIYKHPASDPRCPR